MEEDGNLMMIKKIKKTTKLKRMKTKAKMMKK